MTGNILAAAALSDPILPRRTAYQIRCAFAAFAVGGIVWARGIDCLEAVAVLLGKAFVQTLVRGIDGIIVIAAA